MLSKRYQFVWWGWKRWAFPWVYGPWPTGGSHRGCIYRWMFVCGPFEIRRWTKC